MQKGHAGKINYSDINSCFNVIACNIHVKEFFNATHYTLSFCRHRFRGSAATKRRSELNLSDPVPEQIYSLIWYSMTMRNRQKQLHS